MPTAILANSRSGKRIEGTRALDAVRNRIAGIDADLAALPGADTATTKQILGRALQTQQKILQYLLAQID